MGVDITYYCVVGVRIEKAPFEETGTSKRKSGEHDFPESFKYHPETGRALWVEWNWTGLRIGGKFYDDFAPFGGDTEDSLLSVFPASLSSDDYGVLDRGCIDYSPDVFVGKVLGSMGQWGDDDVFVPLNFEFEEIRATVQDHLEPLGLWNEEIAGSFGVHFFVNAS